MWGGQGGKAGTEGRQEGGKKEGRMGEEYGKNEGEGTYRWFFWAGPNGSERHGNMGRPGEIDTSKRYRGNKMEKWGSTERHKRNTWTEDGK